MFDVKRFRVLIRPKFSAGRRDTPPDLPPLPFPSPWVSATPHPASSLRELADLPAGRGGEGAARPPPQPAALPGERLSRRGAARRARPRAHGKSPQAHRGRTAPPGG